MSGLDFETTKDMVDRSVDTAYVMVTELVIMNGKQTAKRQLGSVDDRVRGKTSLQAHGDTGPTYPGLLWGPDDLLAVGSQQCSRSLVTGSDEPIKRRLCGLVASGG
jgi:hypothetical protein